MNYFIVIEKGWPLIIDPAEVPLYEPSEIVGAYGRLAREALERLRAE